MTTRHGWIFGLAGLGLVMAIPVQAAPNFMDDVIMVAKRDRADASRQDRQERRDARQDAQRGDARQDQRHGDAWRQDGRDEPKGYGYGYERRQQRQFEDGRPRDRR